MRAARARLFRDPALAVTVAALWALLALFVIYPLLMLAGTAFVDEGRPALHPVLDVLQKPGTWRALGASLSVESAAWARAIAAGSARSASSNSPLSRPATAGESSVDISR